MGAPKRESRWSWSDKLAIALACLAAAMSLVLLWMEKTPTWAAVTIGCISALIVYPVLHFVHSSKARVPILVVAWALIGMFGWRIWPRPITPPVVVNVPPTYQQPTIDQSATDSQCSNLVAGSDSQIKCEAEKGHHDKDKDSH